MNRSIEERGSAIGVALRATILALAASFVLAAAPAAVAGAKPPKGPIARLSAEGEALARASKTSISEVPTGFAVVGNTAYRTILEFRSNGRNRAKASPSIRSRLVANDLGTGLSQILYLKRDELLLGLAADGERLYGLAYREISRKRIAFQLLDFSGSPAAPRVVYEESYGDFELLTVRLAGVTPQGEAILVRPYAGANCWPNWFLEDETWVDCAHLVAIGPDGAQRPLAEYVGVSTPVIATADQLVFQRGMRVVVARPDGTETDLWKGDFSSIDVSAAGDVIVAWSSGDKTDYGDVPDSIGGPPSPSGATGTTGDDRDPYAPASGIARVPLGAPASAGLPVLDGDAETSTAIACGAGIVRLVESTDNYDDLRNFARTMTTIMVASSGKVAEAIGGAVGIELRSIGGEFIRTLGTIKADLVGEPLCNNGQAMIPYVAYTRSDATWGPSRYGVFDAR